MPKKKSWLSREELDALDQKLFEYKTINTQIAWRKLEIETANAHNSNLARVMHSNIANIPEKLTILYANDIVLQNLYLFRNTVEKFHESLCNEQRAIFRKRWLDEEASWPEIADRLYFSKRKIYYERTIILENYAKLSGYRPRFKLIFRNQFSIRKV